MALNSKDWQVPRYKVHRFFKKRTKYAIVIPVISEGERIKKQLVKMREYSKMADIILADGGSTDGSTAPTLLRKFGVRAILFNIDDDKGGQGTQVRLGLSWALKQRYEGVITIDGNNKDNPSTIPRFIKALDDGYDYVQASRFIEGGKHKNTPLDRLFFNRFVISPLLSLAAGKWYTDTPLGFRGYSGEYLLHPKVKPFRNVFVRYEHLWYLLVRANQLGLKSKEIPTTRVYPLGKIPTKIVGWKKVADFLQILKVALGFYSPS